MRKADARRRPGMVGTFFAEVDGLEMVALNQQGDARPLGTGLGSRGFVTPTRPPASLQRPYHRMIFTQEGQIIREHPARHPPRSTEPVPRGRQRTRVALLLFTATLLQSRTLSQTRPPPCPAHPKVPISFLPPRWSCRSSAAPLQFLRLPRGRPAGTGPLFHLSSSATTQRALTTA